MTESKFTVNGWNFGREGRGLCVCVLVGGVLLGERGVTEREFTVNGGNFGEGLEERSGAERSGAKRSEAERSGEN